MGNSRRQDTTSRSPSYELEPVAPLQRPPSLVLPPCNSAPVPSTLPPPAYELHSQDTCVPAEVRRNRTSPHSLESQSRASIKSLSPRKSRLARYLLLVGGLVGVLFFIYAVDHEIKRVKAARELEQQENYAWLISQPGGESVASASFPAAHY